MRLTNDTIERIKDASIKDVINHFITLKTHGNTLKACCPFHDEKTPSFTVSEQKDRFKCFGCGVSGDAISFVMQKDSKTFLEACEEIGKICHIHLEYEDAELSEKEKERLSAAELQEKVLNMVVPMYKQQLLQLIATGKKEHKVLSWLHERHLITLDENGLFQPTEILDEYNIGWCTEGWRDTTGHLIERELFEPASKLGVIKTSENNNHYDGYRSRIIFPIKDRHGRFIGIGGRYIQVNAKDSTGIPKYINPPLCELYNKSNVLFGLDRAIKAIRKRGFVYLSEGYMDVISPSLAGYENIVSTCGTALTDGHIAIIKRFTDRVVTWRDNDAAGTDATVKDLALLLRQSISAEVAEYTGKDPDQFIQNNYNKAIYKQTIDWQIEGAISCYILCEHNETIEVTDGIIWYARKLWNPAAPTAQRISAKKKILEIIAAMPSEIMRNNCLDMVIGELNWKASDTKRELKQIIDQQPEQVSDNDDQEGSIKYPTWVSEEQKEEMLRSGYVAINRKDKNGKPIIGYYSFTASGKVEITNFIIRPLFHVYAGTDSRYMIQVDNGYRKSTLDMPAKLLPSIDQFQGFLVSEGAFMIYGSKNNWLRIVTELLHSFPRCIEISTLGWHKHGFFAYVDKVYVPGEGLRQLDNWGIFEHKDERYLIPASCEAYRDLQKAAADPFENDRHLTYKESPIRFSEWAARMHRVYKEDGRPTGSIGVAYSILTLFRDIIFDVDRTCPHLWAYGEPSSGKSKFAESIAALFYHDRSAFNLNTGTDFAFFNYMGRYDNSPAHLNEFDIDTCSLERLQNIKGVFDGEGRERGKMSSGPKNRTEVMHVRSTLILTGQKLVTADDNSVVTRSIIEPFGVKEATAISAADAQAYTELKDIEKTGITSMLVELLPHRKKFEQTYKHRYAGQLSDWRRNGEGARNINTRILQSYAHLSTCYRMISEEIPLAMDPDAFARYCYERAITWSRFIRSSDTLSEFWRTLEFLVSERKVQEGWDYIVSEETSVVVRNGKNEMQRDFEQPTKVLYLRLNNIHKHFQAAFRNRTGKEALSMDNMLHYFNSRTYFVGPVKQKKFRRYVMETEGVLRPGFTTVEVPERKLKLEEINSSCHCFIYEDLDISIVSDAFSSQADTLPAAVAPSPRPSNATQDDLPFPPMK